MSEGLICCMKKDIRECVRSGKVILFAAMVAGIGLMIMAFTFIFSDIPEALWSQLPGFDIDSLEELISTMYPKMVRENIGVFSYYIGFFFSLVVVLVIHGILTRERDNGKWILPVEQGYNRMDFLGSKILVYGTLSGGCVLAGYLLYFVFACSFMERNMSFGHALFCGVIHALNLFFIVAYTLLLSLLYPTPVLSAVSVIATVILVPDVAGYFAAGKYLPTYLLSFVYDSSDRYGDVAVPLMFNITILAILWVVVSNREDKS